MAINVSVQYNGGLLPGIILLPQCYYHRGTRLNAMKRFRICSLRSHLNVLTFSPLTGGCSEGLLPIHSGHQVRWTVCMYVCMYVVCMYVCMYIY